jgi:uncharacterized protein
MARRKCLRHIGKEPNAVYYKPAGIRLIELEEIILELDEFEAIKLADFEKLYQEDAAEKMNVSRPTFGRIINSAHYKIADALVNGKAVKISGGNVISVNLNKNKGELNENCCPYKK